MEETIRDEITRKDGVTYKRKPKDKKYDCYLSVKVKAEMRDKLKKKCKENGTNYAAVLRRLVRMYIDS